MKIIYSKSDRIANKITSVTASSENANFPASNLIVGNPSRVWRSVTATAPIANQTITVTVPAGVNNAIGVFGVNANTVQIAIQDVTETTLYFSSLFTLVVASPAYVYNRLWMEWPSNGFALHVTISLAATSTSTYHECGEIIVGETLTLPDPLNGLSQSRENKQIVQELAGGGFYVHDGATPRAFDLNWTMDRTTEFSDVDLAYSVMGQKPIAMLLSDNANSDLEWCGIFHMIGSPKATHVSAGLSNVAMSIREAV